MQPLPIPKLDSLRRHPLVWLVALLSCIPYLLLSLSDITVVEPLQMPGQLSALLSSDWWRLWSPTFVHYTLIHLITNLYLWWYFAAQIEGYSRFELIQIALISAAVANLCQWFFVGPNFGGLSGLVYGLLGYTWLLQLFDARCHYQVDKVLGLLLLLFIPLSATGMFGLFADYAHLGGLCCGVILGGSRLLVDKKLRTKT